MSIRDQRHPKLIILVGIPGSGKSHWAKSVLGNGHYSIVSSDDIRVRYVGDINSQAHNDFVFSKFHQEITDRLDHGIDTVADSTALGREARSRLREIAQNCGAQIHLVVFCNLRQAVRRNWTRERRVPDNIMIKMLRKYEQAMNDYPHEWYDSVLEIQSYG